MTTAPPTSVDSASLAAQLAESLTRASWRLRRTSVRELAPLGLTFAQSRVLRILARHGAPLRIGDLAARLEVAPRSATSMVDSLETIGLVQRQADATDRRSVLLALTPEGLALMERMSSLRRASAEALFSRLTYAQQEALLAILTLLSAPASECGNHAPGAPAADSAASALRPPASRPDA
jgi:DNA-binding MarR family transcriptional regulator